MGRKRTPGLQKIGNTWHIDKQVNGRRICESTGSDILEEAERYLARRLETLRQASIYGVRPKRIFREAATKFLLENQHKRSLDGDAGLLKGLDAFIGDLPLDALHRGVLESYITKRRQEGVKARTINHGLKIVRHILNLAAGEWMDEHGLTWLASAPKIKLLEEHDMRKPYPLDWEEQEHLFAVLPPHLRDMALFAVNTGCRDQEVCGLRWDWEVKIPLFEIGFVFIIPGSRVKNGKDRLVIMNKAARTVVEKQRGKHGEFVFTYRGKPLTHMLNNGWRKARNRVGLSVRVHDLKHTFGRRLRAAGVSFEDRQDLLGHISTRMTTHYSSAELLSLWEAANRVCSVDEMGSGLTILRVVKDLGYEKVTNSIFSEAANTV